MVYASFFRGAPPGQGSRSAPFDALTGVVLPRAPRRPAGWVGIAAVTFSLVAVVACGRMNEGTGGVHSQLEDLSRAALRIQTTVSIGTCKPVAESLNELAYQ